MPKIKPGTVICMERGRDDSIFYYGEFKSMLIENSKTSDPTAGQDLARLLRWIASYEIFATEYHKKNFVLWKDCFEKEEDANSMISSSMPKPRAPFIPAFDESIKY